MTTVVSIATIPPRFASIHRVLENVLAQTATIDELRLYIPRRFRRFPDYDGSLPAVPAGVRIIQPDDDLGPASKVLFAADDLRGEDCDIIYCDDDMLFEPDLFARLLAARGDRLDHCVTAEAGFILRNGKIMPPSRDPAGFSKPKDLTYRVQRAGQFWRQWRTGVKEQKPYRPALSKAGYVNIAQGYGGVLVRPAFFDTLFYDIPPVLWAVDDYWISGHFERNGVPIWGVADLPRPVPTESREISALYLATLDDARRETANDTCVKYMQDTYGVWQWPGDGGH